jgi:hypothetical protein
MTSFLIDLSINSSLDLATLVEIVRASSGLLLSLGMLSAIAIYSWFNILIPFHHNSPAKPTFTNESNKPLPPQTPKFLEKTPVIKTPTSPIAKPDVLFKAKVNSGIGLVLRAEPAAGGKMSGGADYNAVVEVLKESPDRAWVYIRQPVTKEQGWVRAGNLTRS